MKDIERNLSRIIGLRLLQARPLEAEGMEFEFGRLKAFASVPEYALQMHCHWQVTRGMNDVLLGTEPGAGNPKASKLAEVLGSGDNDGQAQKRHSFVVESVKANDYDAIDIAFNDNRFLRFFPEHGQENWVLKRL